MADLQLPSARSGPTSAPSAKRLCVREEEHPSTTIAAPETSIAAPTAEATSTISAAPIGSTAPSSPSPEDPPIGHIDPTMAHFPGTAPAAAPPYAAPGSPYKGPPFPKAKAKTKAKPKAKAKAKAKAVVKKVMKAKPPCKPSKMPSRPPEKRKFSPISWGPCTISCGGKPGLYRLIEYPGRKPKMFKDWKRLCAHLRSL